VNTQEDVMIMQQGHDASRIDMGALRRLKILCISETGWHDTPTLLADVRASGGINVNQYDIPWPPFGHLHPENAAGSSSLVEVEETDGTVHRFLFDTGWGMEWMERRFTEEGIDQRLQRGEIEFLAISHEHFDHFWGIRATVKHCREIPIYVPRGFHREGFDLLTRVGHTGPVTVVEPGDPVVPFPGLAIANFPMQALGRVSGENAVYARIAGKGLTLITGCGHGGVLDLLNYGRKTFEGEGRIYALYGGLHISPFGEWDERREALVQALLDYGIEHVGCNHCTGEKAVQRMVELGLPVTRGTARHGSKTDLYLGNGDVLELESD
jgi:7,8-dihydropterin-6-yl-methyl-4-(beta-D-ribofuranosyl)aminobenzene 5'-phosphate synthase